MIKGWVTFVGDGVGWVGGVEGRRGRGDAWVDECEGVGEVVGIELVVVGDDEVAAKLFCECGLFVGGYATVYGDDERFG